MFASTKVVINFQKHSFLMNYSRSHKNEWFLTFRNQLIYNELQKSYKNDLKKNKKNDTTY